MRTAGIEEGTARPAVRRLSGGAEVVADGVHFRVWAPGRRSVDVRIESGAPGVHPLAPEGPGYQTTFAERIRRRRASPPARSG